MRIGLDGRSYRASTGGIGRYTRELVKYLLTIDKENEYVLFLTDDDDNECKLSAKNLKKVIVPFKFYSVAEQAKFSDIIKQESVDLMHFLNFNHPVNYRGKFITTIHDLTMNFFPVGRQKNPLLRIPYLFIMKHAAQAADAVIVPTKTVKDDVVDHLKADPKKIHSIYEGADIPTSVPKINKGSLKKLGITKPYILFVSQWRPHKGLGTLIEAFNEMKAKQDIQLVISGKANAQFPEIPAAIEASTYRGDIITPGFVDDETLDALYAGAELFVFPSWYEGFGLPPLEAMARGVPVASSNTSVMPEVLGEAAVYFDPRDPADISHTITQTLNNRELLVNLRKKGIAQAAKYSWKKMAEETLALYRKVVDGRSGN